jgi:AraC-like DNA-binding protein
MSAPWDRDPPTGLVEVETDDDTFMTVDAWPKDVFQPHYHDEFNWIVPMRPGRVVVRVEQREHTLDVNRWICIFPCTPHAILHVSDDCEVLSLFLSSAAMLRGFPSGTALGERCILGGAGAVAQGLALAWGELRFAGRSPDVTDDALERFLAGWLWRAYHPRHEIVDDWGVRLRVGLGRDGDSVAEFVEAHLADAPFPWDRLAAQLEISRRTLQRQFTDALGQSTSQVLAAMRLDRAKQLLVDPARPIGDVALACGFSSQSHFSTAFKLATGLSPRDFRRQLLG